jgi:hypothetical protein
MQLLPRLLLPLKGLVIPFHKQHGAGMNVGVLNAASGLTCAPVLTRGLIGVASDEVDRRAGSVISVQGGGVKAMEITSSSGLVRFPRISDCAKPAADRILSEQSQESLCLAIIQLDWSTNG